MMWDLAACRADRDDIRQLVQDLSERFGRDLDVLDVFFPPSTHTGLEEQTLVAAAKTVCAECPIVTECGEHAARHGLFDGIHGGLRREQKIALARRLGVRVSDDPLPASNVRPCGTYAAYRRHKREGTAVCEPCRVAHRLYRQEQNMYRRTDAA